MKEVERTLEITGRAEDFRQSLIAKIGAWSLDHRGQKPVMSEIFADLLRKLRDAYFEKHKKTIAKGIADLVMLLSGNERQPGGRGADARRDRARDVDRRSTVTRASRRAISSARSRRSATADISVAGAAGTPVSWTRPMMRVRSGSAIACVLAGLSGDAAARPAKMVKGPVPPGPRADVDHGDVAARRGERRRRLVVDGPGGERVQEVGRGADRRGRDRGARSRRAGTATASRSAIDSWEGEFATAPPHRQGRAVLVHRGRRHAATASSSTAAIVERMAQEVPDFVLGTGDMVDDGSRQDQWQQFFDVESPLLRDNVYFPARRQPRPPGPRAGPPTRYRAYFSVPENGGDTERYYAFTLRGLAVPGARLQHRTASRSPIRRRGSSAS